MSFINRYYDYKMFADLGLAGQLDELDVFDAEAFELIHNSINKARLDK